MGNCCCTRISLTDNNAENLIRESISLLKIRKIDFNDLDEELLEIIKISLLDIKPHDILKWITRENYNKIQNDILINNLNLDDQHELSSPLYQKSACINYDDFIIVDEEYKNEHSNNFLLWVICNIKSPNRLEKIKLIEKVILVNDKMLTFKTFKKFLTGYIYINLYKTTFNFKEDHEILLGNKDLSHELNYLTQHIYNVENISNYTKKLLEKLKEKVQRKSVSINNEKLFNNLKNISNEFLKINQLIKFFNENYFLLDVMELRDNYFSIFHQRAPYYLHSN